MDRIIWHWTAGAYGANKLEKDSYHFIIDRDGTVVRGDFLPEDNIPPLKPGKYAAHTLNANSNSIGISIDAMGDAKEKPFSAGKWPITEEQVDALIQLTAVLCGQYEIPVSRETTLSHAEVQPTLGIKQKNKWDISWLPGMAKPGDPVADVGDVLRAQVALRLGGHQPGPGVATGDANVGAGGAPQNRPLLRIGDRGHAVVALQTKLIGAGYNINIDGIFGPMTYSCVRWFQAREGLVIDGIVGPNTWAKLEQ